MVDLHRVDICGLIKDLPREAMFAQYFSSSKFLSVSVFFSSCPFGQAHFLGPERVHISKKKKK